MFHGAILREPFCACKNLLFFFFFFFFEKRCFLMTFFMPRDILICFAVVVFLVFSAVIVNHSVIEFRFWEGFLNIRFYDCYYCSKGVFLYSLFCLFFFFFFSCGRKLLAGRWDALSWEKNKKQKRIFGHKPKATVLKIKEYIYSTKALTWACCVSGARCVFFSPQFINDRSKKAGAAGKISLSCSRKSQSR